MVVAVTGVGYAPQDYDVTPVSCRATARLNSASNSVTMEQIPHEGSPLGQLLTVSIGGGSIIPAVPTK